MVLEVKKGVFIDTDNILHYQKKNEKSSQYTFLLSNPDNGQNYILNVSGYLFKLIKIILDLQTEIKDIKEEYSIGHNQFLS